MSWSARTSAFLRGFTVGWERTWGSRWFLAARVATALFISALCFREGWWTLGTIFGVAAPLAMIYLYQLVRTRTKQDAMLVDAKARIERIRTSVTQRLDS